MKQSRTGPAAGIVRNSLQNFNITHRRGIIKKDAHVLHILRKQCAKSGKGTVTLQAIFTGLMAYHDRHLMEFSDALREAGQ